MHLKICWLIVFHRKKISTISNPTIEIIEWRLLFEWKTIMMVFHAPTIGCILNHNWFWSISPPNIYFVPFSQGLEVGEREFPWYGTFLNKRYNFNKNQQPLAIKLKAEDNALYEIFHKIATKNHRGLFWIVVVAPSFSLNCRFTTF